ncbi:unnamed protein product [Rotaria magnacalcarata]|uniref:Receptor ligand binding region domain-containing protein n=1 Tax=Rotaria magnacalcarata TaxID=392030 RepID=A0A815NLF1_9BILA|nr:unnamed protein product [Rotaria magnacalcarata]
MNGTESFRSYFILLLFCLIIFINHGSGDRKKIILNSLFTHSSYPSINFALQQIDSLQMDIILELNTTEEIIPCDVGTSVKILFNIINKKNWFNVLISDACQNVLSYIAEAATYFHIPVFSFTESDLSLSSIERYPLCYHVVPSDRAHNLVRKQLLQYYNWTRFGLIYQHGSKYTLPSSDDSDIELTSTIDEEENELVQIDNNLCLNSDDRTDNDMNIQDNSTVQSYPAVRTSEDDENDDSDLKA